MAFIYFPSTQATLNTEQITRIIWSTNETLKGFVHLAGDASDKNSVVTLSGDDAEKLWGIMHPNEAKPPTA
ncbi:MAG: hypothetical protein KME27_21375 [Lyngbya sp. HA4199-MV5]|jgi:hypothetical protein|nr:hypothetical protein [Lyngbya sp. HA4199-MV5]